METYKEENNRYTSFTITDNNRLQTLQNKLNRLLTDAQWNTPTIELLEQTNSLSIQQMIAFQTIMMAWKIMKTKQPEYLARNMNTNTRIARSGIQIHIPKTNLAISREGFVQRGISLINKLDQSIKQETDLNKFKL